MSEPTTEAAPEPLRDHLGRPIEPHSVDGVEADHYYCSTCGHEVEFDDIWLHKDQRYQAW